jgi:hypothetical protein
MMPTHCRRPCLIEPLETRRLLATITVDSLLDKVDANDGVTTLREAIHDAAAGDTLDLTGLAGTITVGSAFEVSRDLTLLGPGAKQLTIDGRYVSYLDPLFNQTNGDVAVSGLTLSGATAQGWLATGGTVSLSQVALTKHGVGLSAYHGVDVTITDSWIADNNRTGVLAQDTVTLVVSNSTFTKNGLGRDTYGITTGGVVVSHQVAATLTNNTFAGNDRGIMTGWSEGAQSFTGSLAMTNNLLAGDFLTINGSPVTGSSRHDPNLTQIGGHGHNVVGRYMHSVYNPDMGGFVFASNPPLIVDGVDGNQVGVNLADVKVGAVGDHGGPTPTVPLLPFSPAINAGYSPASAADQRGVARQGGPDIGAFEYTFVDSPPAFSTTTLPPINVGRDYAATVAAVDPDAGDTLALTATNLPGWLTLTDHGDGTASLAGTPPHQGGSMPIDLQVSDGTKTTTATLALAFRVPVAEVEDGVLHVAGRPQAESIQVRKFGDQIRITRDGDHRHVPLAGVTGVRVMGMGGDDTLTAGVGSLPVTVVGGTGNDTIQTGAGDDLVTADAGNDHVSTTEDLPGQPDGDDRVYGGDGHDTIDVGHGNNSVFADNGNDTVTSGAGNDTLRGGFDDDSLNGGDGTDELRGHYGDDTLTITAYGTLWGDEGNDTLTGGYGGSTLIGGDGNDVLWSDTDFDTIQGGDGFDTLYSDDDGSNDGVFASGIENFA